MSELKKKRKTSSLTSYKYYKLFVESSKDCFWIFDYTNQCFKYISPSVSALLGLTIEDVMKVRLEHSFPKISLLKIREKIVPKTFTAIGRLDGYESNIEDIELYCSDGTVKTVDISARLFLNKKTNCVEIIGVTRDTTKQKQLENELLNKLKYFYETRENDTDQIANATTPDLKVYFFHKFTVYGKNSKTPMKWRTRKTEELFAFFLHNKDLKLSKAEIFDALWPDISPNKATTYLHTTLYNIKKDLLAEGVEIKIHYVNGYYSCEFPLFYSDLQEFRDILCTLHLSDVNTVSVKFFEKIISIYRGDYLGGNDYLWAFSEGALYRQQFENAALSLAQYYVSINNYEQGKNLLIKLINSDNLNENFYELLFEIYSQTKEYLTFKRHYMNLEHLLETELKAKPKSSIQRLYTKMMKETGGQ